MPLSLEKFLVFVMQNLPLISLISEALDQGVKKDLIMRAVKAQITALSDEQIERELTPTPKLGER